VRGEAGASASNPDPPSVGFDRTGRGDRVRGTASKEETDEEETTEKEEPTE